MTGKGSCVKEQPVKSKRHKSASFTKQYSWSNKVLNNKDIQQTSFFTDDFSFVLNVSNQYNRIDPHRCNG
jgi:hypothetical protein